jgi:hypothetical protein
MSTPILATKLYVPPPQPKVVLRPRLIERLNEGLLRKLTLISSPAGFGKTTLLSEWLAGCELPAAWLSLDEGDNDPTRFLAYLLAALQTIAANVGEGVLGLLQSPQPPPTETILTALLNEITTIAHDFVLVLDDYHVIDARAVDEALTFVLDHLPSQMHLVIATREDPHLPLARLRARGQLSELRADDLRFTPDEAAHDPRRVRFSGRPGTQGYRQARGRRRRGAGTRSRGWRGSGRAIVLWFIYPLATLSRPLASFFAYPRSGDSVWRRLPPARGGAPARGSNLSVAAPPAQPCPSSLRASPLCLRRPGRARRGPEGLL